jgi:GNAT superfamily N-acetyltransferase
MVQATDAGSVTAQNQMGLNKIERLAANHDRSAFSCGVSAIDTYLQRHARQDSDRNLAAIYVLTPDSRTILGFYTLSASSILPTELPEALANKLPRFPLPATLLGRMGVNQSAQGQSIGKLLLMHALERALLGSKQVASWAVIVDAKLGARDFYLKYEFAPLTINPDRLFLPMKTIHRLFPSS